MEHTSLIQKPEDLDFVFFGTPLFSVTVLDILKDRGFIPKLIVTTPDAPQGRKLILTPPAVKVWAEKQHIPVIQPARITASYMKDTLDRHMGHSTISLFVVVAYGLLLPDTVINLPTHKTLNLHPSLLPRLRGPSPIESAILSEEKTGVTIMLLDKEMDHGPLIAQKEVTPSTWPPYKAELTDLLSKTGGDLLAETLIPWVTGSLPAIPQRHEEATYCHKITKQDMEFHLSDDPRSALRKIRAYADIHGPYAFFFDTLHNGARIRVKVTSAYVQNDVLVIERVIPENKKEMSYAEYLTNIARRDNIIQ